MDRVDELTLSYDSAGGKDWTLGVKAESAAGVDLAAVVNELLKEVGAPKLAGLPPIRAREVLVSHGSDGFRARAAIALPEDFKIDLRRLPLVGRDAGEEAQITFDELAIEFTHADDDWALSFAGHLCFAGKRHKIELSPGQEQATGAQRKLLETRRSFGPLTVDGLDLDIDEQHLRVKLCARVGRGRVALEVIGLQAKVPFACPADVAFSVDGLAVNYDLPPVTVSGGLLIVADTQPRRYDGSLAVRAGDYGLSAIGSYAETDEPSLFAFLQVLVPIGGPPYFYVNRISGGFGLNRELQLPPIEELESFPLIAGFDNWAPARPGTSVASAITRIGQYLGQFGGGHWLAAGLGVSSFGLVETTALLTLAFRGRVEIGVLGQATLEFPPAGRKIVNARMVLRTVVSPEHGEFSARGQLSSDSYVLDPDCRLTGGFAFCVWFKPPHTGDFVLTLGGYHPAFRRPDHYPTVPRLGVAWSPPGVPLTIKGTQYFALTPALVMLGGLLEANWDNGPLRARFTIQADFLVAWAPFNYKTTFGVNFALEVRLGRRLAHTVAVNVGADLELWGPPFSGRATIDFGVSSFTIEFGEEYTEPADLTWDELREQLLGPRETLLRLRIRDGSLGELAPGRFAVDAEHFEAVTELVVPARKAWLKGKVSLRKHKPFAIAPMGLEREDVISDHEVEVEHWTGSRWEAYAPIAITPVTAARAPKALWERQCLLDDALDDEPFVEDLTTGVRLRPVPERPPAWHTVAVGSQQAGVTDGPGWTWPRLAPRAPATPDGLDPEQRRAALMAAVFEGDDVIEVTRLEDAGQLGLRASVTTAMVAEA